MRSKEMWGAACADYFTAAEFFRVLDSTVLLVLKSCRIPHDLDWRSTQGRLSRTVTAEDVEKLKVLVDELKKTLDYVVRAYGVKRAVRRGKRRSEL